MATQPEGDSGQASATTGLIEPSRWTRDSYPTLREVIGVFNRHHAHHRDIPYDMLERDLGSESELSKDYAGRVLFELFQNAVDRAKNSIFIDISIQDGSAVLRVANDGQPFRVNATYNPLCPDQDRMDFHALCSLHTSAKQAANSIGNKGVGFRSVFTLGPQASVWSRLRHGGWWGLGLTRAGTPSDTGTNPKVDNLGPPKNGCDAGARSREVSRIELG